MMNGFNEVPLSRTVMGRNGGVKVPQMFKAGSGPRAYRGAPAAMPGSPPHKK